MSAAAAYKPAHGGYPGVVRAGQPVTCANGESQQSCAVSCAVTLAQAQQMPLGCAAAKPQCSSNQQELRDA